MRISGRAAIRWIAVLAALAGTAACGFEPLYGRKDNGSVVDDLAAVRIELIADRSGQILRNYLLDDLNPRGTPAQATYILSVRIFEPRTEVGLQRDDTVTRYAYGVSAQYQPARFPRRCDHQRLDCVGDQLRDFRFRLRDGVEPGQRARSSHAADQRRYPRAAGALFQQPSRHAVAPAEGLSPSP